MENEKMILPDKVNIWEVLPRDGFQMEDKWIPTQEKIRIIRGLTSTGIKRIEVTSFVHPRAIPQLKDAEEVVKQVQDLDGIKFRALVPNLRGAERAINAGMKKIKILLSATDSHSLSNSNCLVREAQMEHLPIVELAGKYGVEVGGSIAVAFGCPYEGEVPLEKIVSILERYQDMGVNEVSLADTVGMGNPKQVSEMLRIIKKLFPSFKFTLHLHNTRGMAFANAVAALQQGVTDFDSSTTGLGGCPYAPNAAGNLPTEDLVHGLHEMGIRTGINLDSLLEIARDIKHTIGHDGGSFILKAGPNSRLHTKPKSQKKLG
ncbi:Hydroxymethylglutaryl-CoA lyase YngG [Peribacillus sp. Bi96]|uniref:hydroxymethylglutaryl-CoA lyase n=1 Tax=unclassified Peribacillus TaxID=2675266 RepID=UPI001E008D7C|nr:hydroxymethylglutaryl-CoA lyase [Peribacillus sp. Bi96]CAH0249818.1 Hydroxymethylglutaryl-CoA lyase YngG [Peribacillus sp. Bi96]